MIVVEALQNIAPEVMDGMEAGINAVLRNIMTGARSEWKRIAGKGLRTTRQAYLQAIQKVRVEKGVGWVSLVGELPHIIEDGMDLLDMHKTLLGPKVPLVPVGKKGKHKSKSGSVYRAIPFRHQTPGTVGVGGGVPMEIPYKSHDAVSDSMKLAQDVYQEARKLAPTKSMPEAGVIERGGRLPAGLAPLLQPEPRVLTSAKGDKYVVEAHVTDIFAGMIKSEKFYEQVAQRTYMTFRTISSAKPNKWIRPRTEGRHFAEKVQEYVQQVAPKAFEAFLETLS